ncbi:hypothetical protein A5819_003525 [Enterococcus sp. 7E2_DIV0204]|uniref:glucosaminidase domain-containing protein n=1 Tax=unclassified Enterococcus TaxID=2608891 RepID=UPI000A3353BE|nr:MULTISPECIES: glucosaminidase domain-containing protein [unclassified Enterococcus]OTN83975.1 hypothetical protein A5819_003525 [Enterococcus sp. 7E2_DIV0204]OTP46823.1 hypothetical protein A5884_003701 [Enterococcus sp. 7D2_DIV0200]
MKKKTLSLLLATVLFSSGLPLTTFAEEVQQTPQESSEQAQEVETSTSESITQESSSQPIAPPTESTQESQPIETTESSNETIPSVDPISSEVVGVSPAEVIQEAPPVNEAIIPVEPSSIHFDREQTTEEFVARIGDQAREVGLEKNLFGSVMIAQAILESGSGGSQLSQAPYNNLFGIKGDYEGQSVTLPTLEDDGFGNFYSIEAAFRLYPSYKESFEDYSKLFTDGINGNPTIYQSAWKSEAVTYQNATQALTGVYATDTQYNVKLNSLIETYDLTQYDREKAEVAPSESDFEPYNGKNYDEGNSYAPLNCTQYTYNRIIQLGGYVDLDMGNGADWGATGIARGYEVSHTPKAGTAVSFEPGELGADPDYGHVAFVEKIYSDGSILISEMNAIGLGIVSTRVIPAGVVNTLMYITPK